MSPQDLKQYFIKQVEEIHKRYERVRLEVQADAEMLMHLEQMKKEELVKVEAQQKHS